MANQRLIGMFLTIAIAAVLLLGPSLAFAIDSVSIDNTEPVSVRLDQATIESLTAGIASSIPSSSSQTTIGVVAIGGLDSSAIAALTSAIALLIGAALLWVVVDLRRSQ